jgi:hypothetical protein
MRHDFGFSETDVCNIDKVIEALKELVGLFTKIYQCFFSILGEGGRCPFEGGKCNRRGIFIRI